MSPCTQQSWQPITSCSSSSFPESTALQKHSRASWRPTSLSSFQNSDIVSLFALVIGEEGLQRGPFFVGPYEPLRALCCLECLTFDLEWVGGRVVWGVRDDGGVMGERGGGPGVAGLRPVWGGGMGMAIDREGGAEADCTRSGIGCPSPLQVQQRESWRDITTA